MIEFYSHPDKLLVNHLFNVRELMLKKLEEQEKFLRFNYFTNLRKMINYISIFHDFGKFTSFFQKYLKTGKSNSRNHEHTLISALVAMNLFLVNEADEAIDGEELEKRIEFLETILIGLVIANHHRKLMDFSERLDDIVNQSILINQIEDFLLNVNDIKEILNSKFLDFNFEKLEIVLTNLRENLEDENFFINYEFSEFFKDFWLDDRKYSFVWYEDNKKIWDEFFGVSKYLFSLLVESDKFDAAGIGRDQLFNRKVIPDRIVDNYKKAKFGVISRDISNLENISNINELREYIYRKSEKQLLDNWNKNLFTLTAPTGAGKTLTVYNAALKLREKIYRETNNLPRIFYCLPFISIVEQNYKVMEEILKLNFENIEDLSNYLINYSSNMVIDLNEVESKNLTKLVKNKDRDKSKTVIIEDEIDYKQYLEKLNKLDLIIDSFNSEVVITTLNQLWFLLFSNKNSVLKKLNKLVGSIIILDEVQSIKAEYWGIFEEILKLYMEKFNCRVILMTATQPALFLNEEKVELLPEYKEIFKLKYFNRVEIVDRSFKIQLKKEEMEEKLNEFLDFIERNYKNILTSNTLFVFNTKKVAKKFYESLKKKIKVDKFYYLSGDIISKHKKERVKELKDDLESNKRVICVSTQVIEAGVDVDFEYVFREIAPLDSIIQTLGRCNRNGKIKDFGKAFLFDFERGKTVYGNILIEVVGKFLNSFSEMILPDKNLFIKVEDYFLQVRDNKNFKLRGNYEKLLESIASYDLTKINREFADLIESYGESISFFFTVDDEAENLWNEYMFYKEKLKKVNKNEIFLYKTQLSNIVAKMSDYILSIPEITLKTMDYSFVKFIIKNSLEKYSSHIIKVENQDMDGIYDLITGIKYGRTEEFIDI